jgi:site-specific DNA-cytosine methylase
MWIFIDLFAGIRGFRIALVFEIVSDQIDRVEVQKF